MQIDEIVQRAATGVLVAAISILAVTAGVMAVPSVKNHLGWPASQRAAYVTGQKIDVPAAAYSSSPRTLLFFSMNSCAACQRSKPVVSSIAADLSKHQQDVRVVMVTGTTFRQDETAFAKSVGIDPSRLIRVDLAKLRVKNVPALVLVNADGRILMAQEGIPTEGQRRDIVTAAISGVF